MERICVIAAERSPLARQVVERLSGHFGAACVIACFGDELPSLAPGDVVVLLLAATAGEPQGAPWSERSIANHPHVATALAGAHRLIPVLVDGLKMPSPEQLPPAVQSLSYQHAIAARSGPSLNHDVGRLIGDLEAHLQQAVGAGFPYEHIVLPIGLLLAVVGGFYAVIRLREATDWSFAYETPHSFEAALARLNWAGPAACGAGLACLAAAAWLRRQRLYLRQRADAFRSGSDRLPPATAAGSALCLGAGLASWGWGWPAAAVSVAAGLCSAWLARRAVPRPWRAIGLGLALALAGLAWTRFVDNRVNLLRETLVLHELGRNAAADGELIEAEMRFRAAIAVSPEYANAWRRLAETLDQQGNPNEALVAVERALQLYPAGRQGLVSPPTQAVDEAHQYQADLLQRLSGKPPSSSSFQLGFNFNLFGGLLRFW